MEKSGLVCQMTTACTFEALRWGRPGEMFVRRLARFVAAWDKFMVELGSLLRVASRF